MHSVWNDLYHLWQLTIVVAHFQPNLSLFLHFLLLLLEPLVWDCSHTKLNTLFPSKLNVFHVYAQYTTENLDSIVLHKLHTLRVKCSSGVQRVQNQKIRRYNIYNKISSIMVNFVNDVRHNIINIQYIDVLPWILLYFGIYISSIFMGTTNNIRILSISSIILLFRERQSTFK